MHVMFTAPVVNENLRNSVKITRLCFNVFLLFLADSQDKAHYDAVLEEPPGKYRLNSAFGASDPILADQKHGKSRGRSTDRG